jgi:hypothetical protein
MPSITTPAIVRYSGLDPGRDRGIELRNAGNGPSLTSAARLEFLQLSAVIWAIHAIMQLAH